MLVLPALALALLFVSCDPAYAARHRHAPGQPFWGQSDVDQPAGSTRCYALSGGSTVAGASAPGQRSAPWIAGTFSALSFRVHVDSAHDIGDAHAWATGTLHVNGAPTALSATIRGGLGYEREAPVDPDLVTVRDGDLVELCATTGPMPSKTDQLHWSVRFESESGEYVYPSVILAGGSSAQHVRALGTTAAGGGAAESATQFLVPLDGSLRMLCTGPRSWTLRRNGADALSCGSAPVAIVAGDLVSLRMGAGSGIGVAGVTLVWTPAQPGEWWLASVPWSTSAARYQRLLGPQAASQTRYSANATPMAGNEGTGPYVAITGLYATGSGSVELVEYPTQNSGGAPITRRSPETARFNSLGPSWYELLVSGAGRAAVTLRTISAPVVAEAPPCLLDRCPLDVATLVRSERMP